MRYRDRVLFKSPLTPWTGYGNDGIGIARGLVDAGCDVYLHPLVTQPPLPRAVADLLMKEVEPPFEYLLHHTDPVGLGCSAAELQLSTVARVAWTMWEFTSFGPVLGGTGNTHIETLKERINSYDVLVVYDEVSREALSPYADIPVIKAQGGYFADEWAERPQDVPERDWDAPAFRFIMAGALTHRKDPWVALAAFRKLREKHPDLDVELHMKNNVRTLHPAIEKSYPGVTIHYAHWSHHQMLAFYHSAHCLLAPSWGEGKNLPALEAMTTGIPVIATQFGGHAEWMPFVEAYSVKYTMGEHQPGMGSARADVDDLVVQMEAVVFDRHEARRRGELAARTIPALCDWSKALERLSFALLDVL